MADPKKKKIKTDSPTIPSKTAIPFSIMIPTAKKTIKDEMFTDLFSSMIFGRGFK